MRTLRLLLIISCATCIFTSCSNSDVAPEKEIAVEISILTDYRLPTPAEFIMLEKAGIWVEGKNLNCEWSDGQYGEVECNGGTCSPVFYPGGSNSTHVCLMCFKGGEPDHAGACRPI